MSFFRGGFPASFSLALSFFVSPQIASAECNNGQKALRGGTHELQPEILKPVKPFERTTTKYSRLLFF